MSAPIYNPSTQTIRATCSQCDGAYSVFQSTNAQHQHAQQHQIEQKTFQFISYMLFRCPGCNRASLGIIHHNGSPSDSSNTYLEAFYPFSTSTLPLPAATPEDIKAEFREAELCAAASAHRAASALFRSVLEKTLKTNGYTKGNDPTLKDLQKRIDAAAADGIITDARKKRAHDEIRSLGNDVLHDDWRAVTAEEVELAHHYTQRILEDFYDDRPTVEAVLINKKKLSAPPPATP